MAEGCRHSADRGFMDLFVRILLGLFFLTSSSVTGRDVPPHEQNKTLSQYLVVAPSELRPDVPFQLFVSNLRTHPVKINAEMVQIQDSAEEPKPVQDPDEHLKRLLDPLVDHLDQHLDQLLDQHLDQLLDQDLDQLADHIAEQAVHHGSGQILVSNFTVVEGGKTQMLILPHLDLPSAEVKPDLVLWIQGRDWTSGEILFTNWTRVQYQPPVQSTLIQTDRSRYRPGDRVKIRVLSLQRNLTGLSSPKDIQVKDPKGNVLSLWSSVDSKLGVSSVEHQLSPSPPLGKWTISATVQGKTTEKPFLVEHYVLPRFKVEINVPKALYIKHRLTGSVFAKHFHGAYVEGMVSIIFIHHSHGRQATYPSGPHMLKIVKSFEFEIPQMNFAQERMIDIEDYDQEYLEIHAQVTESETGLQYNRSVRVDLAKHLYKLSFMGHRHIFHPGTSFNAQLKVQMSDGHHPYGLDSAKVQISVLQQKSSHWSLHNIPLNMIQKPIEGLGVSEDDHEGQKESQGDLDWMELDVPENGTISLSINVKEDTTSLTLDASFQDGSASLVLHRTHTSESGSYLRISGPHTPVQAGQEVTLRIWTSFLLDKYFFLVKAQEQTVLTGSSSSADLVLVLDSAWSPMVSVLVFVVLPHGEIVLDRIQLHIQAELRNHVSLRWKSRSLKPGEVTSLSVSVLEPESLVGILVVDKAARDSVHNDISKQQVMKGLGKGNAPPGPELMGQRHMSDPYSLITECGLQVMTDASYHRTSQPPLWVGAQENLPLMMFNKVEAAESKPAHVRDHFPETWLWMDLLPGESSFVEVSAVAPDSMTSWVASAFVMSPTRGIGFMDAPAEVTVIQSFFLSLNLPPVIIRGEELLLEIHLYNYSPFDLQAQVILVGADGLEFLDGAHEHHLYTVGVRHMGAASVRVPVRPWSVGDISVLVSARAGDLHDLIKRTLHVKAEGLPQTFTKSELLVLTEARPEAQALITYVPPHNVVPDSCVVQISSTGDVLGAAMEDLDGLIQRPYGCGEQNMIHLAPMVYVLQYLSSVGEVDSATTRRARKLMKVGYEQELVFQRGDGSFSAFGNDDPSGSTWLSAFVLRVLLQARAFLPIGPLVLSDLEHWLVDQADSDGRFLEPGRVIHTELVGGRDSELGLTAYVVIALLEDPQVKAERQPEVSAALIFLETEFVKGIKSHYSLSLVTYALCLARSPTASHALNDLLMRANITEGSPMWRFPSTDRVPSRSADIEAVGYLLLALHQYYENMTATQVELFQWLSKQQDAHGGFGSTQNTVVALQALSVYAALASAHEPVLNVTQVDLRDRTETKFHIDKTNSRLLHHSFRSGSCDVSLAFVEAMGRGLLLFQVNVAYNILLEKPSRRRRFADPQDELYLDLQTSGVHTTLVLMACFRLKDSSPLISTGMALLELKLPSGFSLRPQTSFDLDLVKKVETNKTKGTLVLYLDSISRVLQCVKIPLLAEFKVGHVRDSWVEISDYYEPERRTMKTYSSHLNNQSSCWFCGSSCADCGLLLPDNDTMTGPMTTVPPTTVPMTTFYHDYHYGDDLHHWYHHYYYHYQHYHGYHHYHYGEGSHHHGDYYYDHEHDYYGYSYEDYYEDYLHHTEHHNETEPHEHGPHHDYYFYYYGAHHHGDYNYQHGHHDDNHFYDHHGNYDHHSDHSGNHVFSSGSRSVVPWCRATLFFLSLLLV